MDTESYRFNRGRFETDVEDVSKFQLLKAEVVNLIFDRILKEIKSEGDGTYGCVVLQRDSNPDKNGKQSVQFKLLSNIEYSLIEDILNLSRLMEFTGP